MRSRPDGSAQRPVARKPGASLNAARSASSRPRNTVAFDGAAAGRPRMWSAAFSPIMIVGAFRLPVVIDGMIERVDDPQALDADHARLRIDHRHRIARVAHPAGAGRMIGALDILADEGVDRLVA